MARHRCTRCFRPVDPDLLGVHICPPAPAPSRPRERIERTARTPRAQPRLAPQRTQAQYNADRATPHGSKRRYQYGPAEPGFEAPNGGCRCPKCKAKNYEMVRAYRERRRASA